MVRDNKCMHWGLFWVLFMSSVMLMVTGCSQDLQEASVTSDQAAAANLDQELAKIMTIYNQATLYDSRTDTEAQFKKTELIDQLKAALGEWDVKYQSNLLDQFENKLAEHEAYSSRLGSGESMPPLTDLPINYDGAVYLSGGPQSTVGTIIDFISPMATAGRYYHGAILDLDKFDPTNLDGLCFETAITKGAGYETPMDWMCKSNVAVFNPSQTLDKNRLDAAQSSLDNYCSPANTNMQYGFFKNYADIFSVVTKEDNYYWYCTKVVWRVYQLLGIDLDSNTSKIDWTTSGLYSLAKSYYTIRYLFNPSKAKSELANYLQNTKQKLVLAEEIYFSPYLVKIYETIRQ